MRSASRAAGRTPHSRFRNSFRVAKFVVEQSRTEAWIIEKNDPEMELLELFPAIIEKLCERLYSSS